MFRFLLVFLLLLLFLAASTQIFAQTDSLSVEAKKDGELKLSESFLKALDGAFSFGPVAAPLPKPNDLTVEQLHEWVGKPTESRFDEAYKAAKMWQKEFYVPISPPSEKIYLNLGPMPKGNSSSFGFDFNESIGQYFRPKDNRMRRLRKQSKKVLEKLDEMYPLSKE